MSAAEIGEQRDPGRAAETSVAASALDLRAILVNIADGVVTIGESGRIESCNPATLRMFGYCEDELLGHNVSVLISEPDYSRHDSYIRRYIETGEGRIINVGPREAMALRKDGSTFPVELAIGETTIAGRRIFIGTIRDVSPCVRAEEELASSQRELAEAQRIGRFGSWSLDLMTMEAHWSDEMCRLMGVDPTTVKASAELGFETIHPDDQAAVRSNLERVVAGPDRVASFDYRIVPAGAPERVVHAEVRAIEGQQGNPIRVAATAQDVTEARRLAAQLARSEESLARAQRMSHIGSWELDVGTGEMEWSDGLYVVFGLDPAAHKPTLELFYSLVHPDEIEEMQRVAALLWSGEVRKFLYGWRMVRIDGGIRHLHSEVEVDESDRVIRLIGTLQDVTDLRAAEMTLQQALATANEASRSKSEFLANMSHELRTPLNAIIGFSELVMMKLKQLDGGEKLEDYLRDIHESGHHLLGIINDVLDMSRAETNTFVLQKEPLSLSDVVDWVMRMVGETAKAQGIALTADVDDDLLIVIGEERLVRQALLNLVANAIKFTPAGGSITIRATRTAGGDVTIAVVDTGLGMKPEDITVALTPFGQVDRSLNRKFGGTGLGLPLAKKFVELHGGTLSLESAPGQGTTVTLTIPSAPQHGPGQALERPA